jgi:integrase
MATIFKRGGKANRHGRYVASYFDEHGKRVTLSTGTGDYDAASQIANKWETDVALRKRGIINAAQARFADQNQRPLAEHIAEYLEHCRHVGQSGVHIGNKKTQLNKLIAGIGATRLSDLQADRIETYLSGLVKAGKSYRTHNQHRATIVSFAAWCYEGGRITSNALTILPTLNEAKDRRRVRRAMSEDELSRLLAVSTHRASYYLFAYYTGLRVKAVKAATWGDVDLDAATIRVRVGNAKGKREDIYQNLHPCLMDELRKIKPAFTLATTRIFRAVPSVRTFHKDCERAGIPRFDADGRQVDRHALRTTLGTHLARAGVLPQAAMRVMGHTDVRITMKHYTDLRLADTAKAVGALPSIEASKAAQPAALRATGTDDAIAIYQNPGAQQIRQQSGGITQQSAATSGNDDTMATRGEAKNVTLISPRKNRAIDPVRQRPASTDLMIGASADNIQNSRAVGAVG